MPRFKGYVGVRKSVSKRLRKSAERVASTIRRAAFDTVKRGIVGSSVLGLAGSVAATVFEGTRRVLNFDQMDVPSAAPRGAVEDPNAGGYSQRKRVRMTVGSSDSWEAKKQRILGAHLQTMIDRFNAAASEPYWGEAESHPGWFGLQYDTSDVVFNRIPYYLFDLTGAHRNYGVDETAANADRASVPLMQLVREKLSGRYYFVALPGRNADNTGDYFNWQYERIPGTVVPFTRDKAHIDWVDVRMMIYGGQRVPVDVDVQLIQFVDDELCPGAYSVLTGSAPPQTVVTQLDDASGDPAGPTYAKWQTFWTGETDKLIGNPITKRGTQLPEVPYVVLASRKLRFEPNMLTEGDITPHQMEFYLKYDLDRVFDYAWAPTATEGVASAEQGDVNEWQVFTGTKTNIVPHPKRRVFLKITGNTPTSAQIWAEQHPDYARAGHCAGSFDLIVRRKHTVVALD